MTRVTPLRIALLCLLSGQVIAQISRQGPGCGPAGRSQVGAPYAATSCTVTTAHQAQQRARLDGDDALATEIEERLALYAVGEAWVAPGVGGEED